MPKRRILLHPGFHKTGTSSLQHFLWRNREHLAPHYALRMIRHMKPITAIVMAYSKTENPFVLSDLPAEIETCFADLQDDPRDIIISSEGLSGHLPGFQNVETYAAAAQSMVFLTGVLQEMFPYADITILYTLRDPETWLFSAYRHHLKGTRLTLDWVDFARKFRDGSDLSSAAQTVQEAIAPIPVLTRNLEDYRGHPHGPAGMLTELLTLPDDIKFDLVGQGNRGPDNEIAAQYLMLNRSDLTDEALREAKTALAEANGLTGWALNA